MWYFMEITAWFGEVGPDGEFAIAGNVAQMIDRLMQFPPQKSDAGQIQPDLRAIAMEYGFAATNEEYDKLLREVSIGFVRRKLQSLVDDEADLLQMIEALDDLNEVVNQLDERLYEWSRLHTEEILRGEELAELVAGEDAIGELARTVIELRRSRDSLEKRLERTISQIAPNLTELAGPFLAARLISRAGGLKRLSEMPASTIQVIGAEKALFKHIRGKATSPKHGIIYRHPAIMGVSKNLRGRTARAIAGKLAIAARVDYYSGELRPELKESLEIRIAEIKRSPRRRRG
jgi:nucleolar protein 56